ncbi:MAG: translesion DNA synthesis-associated protein ImuA [Pseudohongiellaceae bacterium]
MALVEAQGALAPATGLTQTGLHAVLRNPSVWRARQLAEEQQRRPDRAVATGFAALDAALPDGGWPLGAVTELLVEASGIGELSLLLPALRSICAQGRGLALLAPPWQLHARALQAAGVALERLLLLEASGSDLLWSAEQILRSGECGAVLLWGAAAGRALDQRALQRLQLAAGSGNALCFLYRTPGAAANPSPAPLRLRLAAQDGLLHIHSIKQRGSLRTQPVPLQLQPQHWHAGPSRRGETAPPPRSV